MTLDLLEKRLQQLDIATPDAGRVSAKVVSRQSGRRTLRVPRLVSVPAAVALLVVLVAYFVPVADIAVASRLPWSNELLQWAGLVGASNRITAVNSSTTSAGYRLTMTGAYADSTRTVLLMHAEPAIAAVFSATVTDQFARTYRNSGGVSNMLTGDFEMDFEPMAWPDSITGARITLHAATLQTPSDQLVNGTWELTAALPVEDAKPLSVPAAGDLGPLHIRFTAATYTSATIEVEAEATGVSGEDQSRLVPNGGKSSPALTIEVLDSNGEFVGGGFGGYNPIKVVASRTAGATYVLRVSYYGYGSFDRTLHIPS